MELEEIFGLPAHPLIVHAAVVLLPLAAVVTVVTALVPRTRRHYAPVALALAVLATVAVGLAQGSGEALEERVDETPLVEEHTETAERVLPWAIALTATSAATVSLPILTRRRPSLPISKITAAVGVLAVVTAVGATWSVVSVGHSGAKATWSEIDDAD